MDWQDYWTWGEQILLGVLVLWLIFRIVFTTFLGARHDLLIQDAEIVAEIDEIFEGDDEDDTVIFSGKRGDN